MKPLAAPLVLVLALAIANFPHSCHCALEVGFYRGKCGDTDVEATITDMVHTRFVEDISSVAALLRLQFHDCYVRGCDASILLDGGAAEKTARANNGVREYDFIDKVKGALEKACPGVVSCADIIIAATRDAVSFSGGTTYEIKTGRRDGVVSEASTVDLPFPSTTVSGAIEGFGKKGLSPSDMVTLLGGHTVGVAHCSSLEKRLYNFNGTGNGDPNMEATFARKLRKSCPKNASAEVKVNLDQNVLSAFVVDNEYYRQLLMGRGVLPVDQELTKDARTRTRVVDLAFSKDFAAEFGRALVKLSEIDVLTDDQGEIRRSCRYVN